MEKIACLIHPDAANQRIVALGKFLQQLGYKLVQVASVETAANEAALQSGGDHLVIAPTTEDWGPRPNDVVALANKLAGHAVVIAVRDDISVEEYKALFRTGAGDCVDWKHAPREIMEISRRRRGEGSKDVAANTDVARHLIVGFLPAGGGVGATTLTLETGVHIASQKGKEARRAAAVELDFNRATLCDYVDLAPRLDIAELARNPRRLDEYMLDIFRARHSSGLDLYSTAQPPAHCAATDGAVVFALLGKLHDRYDVLLLDFPSYRAPWSDDALRNCDFVVVTGRSEVPSIKQVARELKRLRELGFEPSRLAAAVTHCETSFIGTATGKSDIEAALPGHRVFCVRDDRPFALEAVNKGVSMMQSRSGRGICKDIRAIADAFRRLEPRKIA